jgi:hypothetical protein
MHWKRLPSRGIEAFVGGSQRVTLALGTNDQSPSFVRESGFRALITAPSLKLKCLRES